MGSLNTLEIKGLTAGYGKLFRIDDINLSVQQGHFIGIVGPNGAGKSTLLKCISGDLSYSAETFALCGKPLRSISLRERAKHIAVVPQRISLGLISVFDYVMQGRLPYRSRFGSLNSQENFCITENYMKKSGVWKYRHQNINKLSGGELQLVAITRALVQEPDLLLLDEPTAHLDIAHQIQILDFIRQLKNQLHLSILMVIHDINLAAEYCSRLILMQNGKIFADGNPAQILNQENIQSVYNTEVIIRNNPISGQPFMLPISKTSKE